MTTDMTQFMDIVSEYLATQYGNNLDISQLNIETDEPTVIVPVNDDCCGLPLSLLVVTRRMNLLFFQVRQLLWLGAQGNPSNFIPAGFMRVTLTNDGNMNYDNNERLSLRLQANTYLASTHSSDELLSQAILAMNAHTTLSVAIKDYRTGEIYVQAYAECDFKDIPESCNTIVPGLLSHGRMIRRFTELMREDVLPESSQRGEITFLMSEVARLNSVIRGHAEKNGNSQKTQRSKL